VYRSVSVPPVSALWSAPGVIHAFLCVCRQACMHLFLLVRPRPPISTLFPYTTLFRSGGDSHLALEASGCSRTQILGMLSFAAIRSEEHTSELQSRFDLVCRLLLEKKKNYLVQSCLLSDCRVHLMGKLLHAYNRHIVMI